MISKMSEKYINFIENWEKLDDDSKILSIDSLYDFFEKSAEKDVYEQNVIDLVKFYHTIWKKQSENVKNVAYPEMISRVKNHILQGDIKIENYEYDTRITRRIRI